MFTTTKLAGLVALAAAVAFVAAGTARAGTSYVYPDAAGDSKTAPDIQQTTLTDNGDGTVGVEIDLAATIPVDGDSAVAMFIDADQDTGTGEPRTGAEFAVFAMADGVVFLKWDGTNWATPAHQPLSPDLEGGRLTFTLTLADIGSTEFDFGLVSLHGDDGDVAPENGDFSYPQSAAKPQIASVLVGATALFPKAGKRFTVPPVQVKLSTGDLVAADSTTCTLTYKGTAIHPAGRCSWTVPKAMKGKRLVLSITAGYQGATASVKLPVTAK